MFTARKKKYWQDNCARLQAKTKTNKRRWNEREEGKEADDKTECEFYHRIEFRHSRRNDKARWKKGDKW